MFGKEPGIVLGALSEVIKAVIPMLIIFNFINWSGEQVAQVMLVVGVAVSFFNVLLTRSQTVTTETANKQIEVGIASPAGTSVEKVVERAARES